MANKGFTIIITALAALAIAGCKTSSGGRSGTAQLAPTQGNSVHGTVKFTETSGGVRVVAHLEGLTPGQHGFHVHEKGDCSAPDATSAGSHFNPAGAPHGAPDAAQRHVGDLGNITADAGGKAHYDRVDKNLRFDGPNSILGRAVIVHAKADDGSQPVGNAGARVACGVIK
jgi:superoxide dismutase, Cu-Zn family